MDFNDEFFHSVLLSTLNYWLLLMLEKIEVHLWKVHGLDIICDTITSFPSITLKQISQCRMLNVMLKEKWGVSLEYIFLKKKNIWRWNKFIRYLKPNIVALIRFIEERKIYSRDFFIFISIESKTIEFE